MVRPEPTIDDMERLQTAVCEMYGVAPDKYGPQVRMSQEWWFTDRPYPALVWEGGPHDWAVEFSCTDTAWTEHVPHGWYPEAYTSYAIGIFPR